MRENIRVKANAMKEINDISMRGEIVVFGSTYMANFPLYELINRCRFENAVYNRSIEGLTLKEALEIVNDCVISISPRKIFLSLGEEDEGDPDAIARYSSLVSEIRTKLPESHLYLIGLIGSGEYVEHFNKYVRSVCDGKKIKFIDFVSKPMSEATLYKARFKQLSCHFRNNPMTSNEAFAIASI